MTFTGSFAGSPQFPPPSDTPLPSSGPGCSIIKAIIRQLSKIALDLLYEYLKSKIPGKSDEFDDKMAVELFVETLEELKNDPKISASDVLLLDSIMNEPIFAQRTAWGFDADGNLDCLSDLSLDGASSSSSDVASSSE